METPFDVSSNSLCDSIPTQLGHFPSTWPDNWNSSVLAGNDIGTPCCETLRHTTKYTCAPTTLPTTAPSPSPTPLPSANPTMTLSPTEGSCAHFGLGYHFVKGEGCQPCEKGRYSDQIDLYDEECFVCG